MYHLVEFVMGNCTHNYLENLFEFFKEGTCRLYSSCPCGIIHVLCFKTFKLLPFKLVFVILHTEECEMTSCIAYDSLVDVLVSKSNPLQTTSHFCKLLPFVNTQNLIVCPLYDFSKISHFTDVLSQPFCGFSYHILYNMKAFSWCFITASSTSEKTMAKIVTRRLISKLPQITLTYQHFNVFKIESWKRTYNIYYNIFKRI